MKRFIGFVVLMAATFGQAGPLFAQGTSFTYQGQLKSGGSPVNNPAVPMSFTLFDAATDGTQIGSTLVFDGIGGNPAPIAVGDGLFTVLLDFGAGIFDGTPRWLEISVDGNTLAPRQEITSAPYAQTCENSTYSASSGYANAPWVTSGSDLYYLAGNVGVGTNTPAANLDVIGTVKMDSLLMQPGASPGMVMTSDASGYGSWQPATGLTLPYSGTASQASGPLFSIENTNDGHGMDVLADSTQANVHAILGSITSTTPGAASVAVRGMNNGTGFSGIGVWGSHNGSGTGVYGTSVSGTGVTGLTTNGNGVNGFSNNGYGVYGSSSSSAGTYGFSGATGGNVYGVQGYGSSTDGGGGVHGFAPSTTGTTKGVTGLNYSNAGIGVLGSAESTSGFTYGVYGLSTSPSGDGVYGYVSTGAGNAGVHGYSNATNGNGVIAEAPFGSSAYALWAKASQGVGVRCDGALQVSGTKSFRIDHPTDPQNKYLYHYCSESPQPLNVYTGNVTTDASGYADVGLPSYFEELNRDFRYQLTVMDASDDFVMAKVVKGVEQNTFRVRTSKPGVTLSWMVIGTRNDRYVRKYGAPVEQEKPEKEKGTYLDPSLWGQPPEKAGGYRPDSARAVPSAHLDARPHTAKPPAVSDVSAGMKP